MKQMLLKISASFMAVIVLLSTLSFTVEKHYCGEYLVDVSFTGNLNRCNDVVPVDAYVKKNDCCKDEIDHIAGQDTLQQDTSTKWTTAQFYSGFDIVKCEDYLCFCLEEEGSFLKDFPPPDSCSNFQVLYQSFLI